MEKERKVELLKKAVELSTSLVGIEDESKPILFFSYAAHCEFATLRYFPNGWHSGADPEVEADVYFDGDWEKVIELLNKVKTDMYNYLSAKQESMVAELNSMKEGIANV